MAPTLTRSPNRDLFILDLGDGENCLTPTVGASLHALLDEVESAPPPRALITMASGRFWSNGLDLEWLAAHPDRQAAAIDGYHRLFARVLGLGVPTIAVLQGHAFAAGAMLALCHDQIVMRVDHALWCLPEVVLGASFTPGMAALLATRLPRHVAHQAMLTARRYDGAAALAAGIVDATATFEMLLHAATARVSELTDCEPEALAAIKRDLHRDAIEALSAPQDLCRA